MEPDYFTLGLSVLGMILSLGGFFGLSYLSSRGRKRFSGDFLNRLLENDIISFQMVAIKSNHFVVHIVPHHMKQDFGKENSSQHLVKVVLQEEAACFTISVTSIRMFNTLSLTFNLDGSLRSAKEPYSRMRLSSFSEVERAYYEKFLFNLRDLKIGLEKKVSSTTGKPVTT